MDVEKARQLLTEIDERQTELAKLCGGSVLDTTARKPVKCSKCGGEGHTARNCDKQTELPT